MRKALYLILAFALGLGIMLLIRQQNASTEPLAQTPSEPPAVYTPPKTVDPALAQFVDRSLPLDTRLPSDFHTKNPEIKNPQDLKLVAALLKDSADDETVRNQASALLRRSNWIELTDALIQILDRPLESPRFRAFVTQDLEELLLDEQTHAELRERIRSRLLAALTDKQVEVRREAVWALVRERNEQGIQTALKWLKDPAPEVTEVRDIAIRCVEELNLRQEIPAVRKYLRDSNQVVRIAAIVALSALKDEESRKAFEEAAFGEDPRLQRAGQAALQKLGAAAK